LDLVIATHPDADRIEGLIELVGSSIPVGDVWFNGPSQLPGSDDGIEFLGGRHRTVAHFLDTSPDLNMLLSGRAVMVEPDGPLPVIEVPGGATLTVLGPTADALERLAATWRLETSMSSSSGSSLDDVPRADTTEGPLLGGDASVNNQASIAVLLEFEGHSVLVPGDLPGEALARSVERLNAERGVRRLFVDVFVVPHAGSRRSVTEELLELVEADVYAFGTDGSLFRHPDIETIEAIGQSRPGATLAFNYRTEFTSNDRVREVAKPFDLHLVYPPPSDEGDLLLAPGPTSLRTAS
jgi:hypothetical protein